jgi:hypothetical protein
MMDKVHIKQGNMLKNYVVFINMKHTLQIIIDSPSYNLGNIFRFTEPSSGQFLKQGNGTFSKCAYYVVIVIIISMV